MILGLQLVCEASYATLEYVGRGKTTTGKAAPWGVAHPNPEGYTVMPRTWPPAMQIRVCLPSLMPWFHGAGCPLTPARGSPRMDQVPAGTGMVQRGPSLLQTPQCTRQGRPGGRAHGSGPAPPPRAVGLWGSHSAPEPGVPRSKVEFRETDGSGTFQLRCYYICRTLSRDERPSDAEAFVPRSFLWFALPARCP